MQTANYLLWESHLLLKVQTLAHMHTLVFITCEGPWLLFEASFLKNNLKGVEKHSCIHMHTPKLYKTVTYIHVVTHLEVHWNNNSGQDFNSGLGDILKFSTDLC